jgi:hypothetical protein
MKADAAYNLKMEKLYREIVLKEKPATSQDGFIPLTALSQPKPKEEIPEEVLGD